MSDFKCGNCCSTMSASGCSKRADKLNTFDWFADLPDNATACDIVEVQFKPPRKGYFINANSATAPGIVDADRQPILERSEVYSGVYGRASINLYAFNSNGNKGIACGLNNLQKIRDGEPLGGKSRAEDDFATADDEDDFLD